jgi:hypothetical protein
VADSPSDRGRWQESEAARLVATGRTDTDTVRGLLILACRSSPLARRFFEDRLGSEELLSVLLGLAADDYSGDAQMTASIGCRGSRSVCLCRMSKSWRRFPPTSGTA